MEKYIDPKELIVDNWYKTITAKDESYYFKFKRFTRLGPSIHFYKRIKGNDSNNMCCNTDDSFSQGNMCSHIKYLTDDDYQLVYKYFPEEAESKSPINYSYTIF